MNRMLLASVIVAGPSRAIAPDSPLLELRNLETALAAAPNNASAIRELAHAYALALLYADPNVVRYAHAALDTSKNVWILGNAAYMLQSQYNETLQRGSANKRAAALARHYFLRARSFDPNLERAAILPQIGRQQIARANEGRAQERKSSKCGLAGSKTPRSAFVDWNLKHLSIRLPGIVIVLRARNCTVPQPFGATSPRNVDHHGIDDAFLDRASEVWYHKAGNWVTLPGSD